MIIAITGRAGTGKTTAARIISEAYSCQLLDLDLLGHQILRQPKLIEELSTYFGGDILTPSAQINRASLAKIAFQNSENCRRLNKITHPLLQAAAIQKILQFKKKKAGKTLLVIGALSKELGLYPYCDYVVVIDATPQKNRQAAGTRASRLLFQRSRAAYLRDADLVIHNAYQAAGFRADCLKALAKINDSDTHR